MGSAGVAPVPAKVETLKVTSTALTDGQPMPAQFACGDAQHPGHSPPLSWSKGPAGTVVYAIDMVDLDRPHVKNGWDTTTKNFVHWRVVNMPADTLSLPETTNGLPPPVPGGLGGQSGLAIENDFGHAQYGGPCPPAGDLPHHYVITVLALSRKVLASEPMPADATLARGSISVTYKR
jgi:Raf kinase inhibitor-like YbhB/YbcL family protein